MILPAPALEDWIKALRTNPDATTTALPSSPYSPQQKPATWHLGMFATAYFYITNQDDVQRLTKLIPELHREFQLLTSGALTRYLSLTTASIARKPPTQEDIEKYFLEESDKIAVLTAFDAPTKESSSRFLLRTIAQFQQANWKCAMFRPGIDPPIVDRQIKSSETTYGLNYFSVNFPLAFWRLGPDVVRHWWLSVLERLKPVQAYMGLGVGLPVMTAHYPFQQRAEFALANHFLGLDVDKPFFMRSSWPDGMHLEAGMRTPSFGVLVAGDYLQRLGGAAELKAKLSGVNGIRIAPCLDGLWIEAGSEPALHPVEQGVPAPLRVLAMALKPVRLKHLWVISDPPNVPSDDIFNPESSERWLRRFDDDSDWPDIKPRPAPSTDAAEKKQKHISRQSGEPCPYAGRWGVLNSPAGFAQERMFKQGDIFPEGFIDQKKTRTGSVIWIVLKREDGGTTVEESV